MLKIDSLNMFYGKIQVLWDVSLAIDEKELVAVIGSNASGKTTMLKATSGLLSIASGTLEYLGRRIDNMPVTGSPYCQNWHRSYSGRRRNFP